MGWSESWPTFDGDELDHDDAKTEAFVCAGLKLYLSRDCVSGDVEWVREGDGDLDLGVMGRCIHGLGPGLRLKSHFWSKSDKSKGASIRT